VPTPIDPQFHPELIDDLALVAAGVTVRGHVRVGAESSLWFGAVIRGDCERVEIGARTNVQDLAVIHSDPGFPCRIGDGVTIGHAAVVHGATVEGGAMIGMRAVVLNGAKIGAGALIAAGAVVTEGTEIPADTLAMGVPAKVIRPLNDDDRERIRHAAAHYVRAAAVYRQHDHQPKGK
jgi:carbonic anhydrase/acetyltransferase-like protein (isoleucine patch superfamily)